MNTPITSSSYSAHVELELIWRGGRMALGQVAGDWIMARTPCDLEPCDAMVIVTVDGVPQHRHVHLPQGMSKHISKTPVVKLEVHAARS